MEAENNNGMVVKRLSVPVGLEELMENLTKEVLLKKPKDIYTFASDYFAHLLALREQNKTHKDINDSTKILNKTVSSTGSSFDEQNIRQPSALKIRKATLCTVNKPIKQIIARTSSGNLLTDVNKLNNTEFKKERNKTILEKHKTKKIDVIDGNRKEAATNTYKKLNGNVSGSVLNKTDAMLSKETSRNINNGHVVNSNQKIVNIAKPYHTKVVDATVRKSAEKSIRDLKSGIPVARRDKEVNNNNEVNESLESNTLLRQAECDKSESKMKETDDSTKSRYKQDFEGTDQNKKRKVEIESVNDVESKKRNTDVRISKEMKKSEKEEKVAKRTEFGANVCDKNPNKISIGNTVDGNNRNKKHELFIKRSASEDKMMMKIGGDDSEILKTEFAKNMNDKQKYLDSASKRKQLVKSHTISTSEMPAENEQSRTNRIANSVLKTETSNIKMKDKKNKNSTFNDKLKEIKNEDVLKVEETKNRISHSKENIQESKSVSVIKDNTVNNNQSILNQKEAKDEIAVGRKAITSTETRIENNTGTLKELSKSKSAQMIQKDSTNLVNVASKMAITEQNNITNLDSKTLESEMKENKTNTSEIKILETPLSNTISNEVKQEKKQVTTKENKIEENTSKSEITTHKILNDNIQDSKTAFADKGSGEVNKEIIHKQREESKLADEEKTMNVLLKQQENTKILTGIENNLNTLKETSINKVEHLNQKNSTNSKMVMEEKNNETNLETPSNNTTTISEEVKKSEQQVAKEIKNEETPSELKKTSNKNVLLSENAQNLQTTFAVKDGKEINDKLINKESKEGEVTDKEVKIKYVESKQEEITNVATKSKNNLKTSKDKSELLNQNVLLNENVENLQTTYTVKDGKETNDKLINEENKESEVTDKENKIKSVDSKPEEITNVATKSKNNLKTSKDKSEHSNAVKVVSKTVMEENIAYPAPDPDSEKKILETLSRNKISTEVKQTEQQTLKNEENTSKSETTIDQNVHLNKHIQDSKAAFGNKDNKEKNDQLINKAKDHGEVIDGDVMINSIESNKQEATNIPTGIENNLKSMKETSKEHISQKYSTSSVTAESNTTKTDIKNNKPNASANKILNALSSKAISTGVNESEERVIKDIKKEENISKTKKTKDANLLSNKNTEDLQIVPVDNNNTVTNDKLINKQKEEDKVTNEEAIIKPGESKLQVDTNIPTKIENSLETSENQSENLISKDFTGFVAVETKTEIENVTKNNAENAEIFNSEVKDNKTIETNISKTLSKEVKLLDQQKIKKEKNTSNTERITDKHLLSNINTEDPQIASVDNKNTVINDKLTNKQKQEDKVTNEEAIIKSGESKLQVKTNIPTKIENSLITLKDASENESEDLNANHITGFVAVGSKAEVEDKTENNVENAKPLKTEIKDNKNFETTISKTPSQEMNRLEQQEMKTERNNSKTEKTIDRNLLSNINTDDPQIASIEKKNTVISDTLIKNKKENNNINDEEAIIESGESKLQVEKNIPIKIEQSLKTLEETSANHSKNLNAKNIAAIGSKTEVEDKAESNIENAKTLKTEISKTPPKEVNLLEQQEMKKEENTSKTEKTIDDHLVSSKNVPDLQIVTVKQKEANNVASREIMNKSGEPTLQTQINIPTKEAKELEDFKEAPTNGQVNENNFAVINADKASKSIKFSTDVKDNVGLEFRKQTPTKAHGILKNKSDESVIAQETIAAITKSSVDEEIISLKTDAEEDEKKDGDKNLLNKLKTLGNETAEFMKSVVNRRGGNEIQVLNGQKTNVLSKVSKKGDITPPPLYGEDKVKENQEISEDESKIDVSNVESEIDVKNATSLFLQNVQYEKEQSKPTKPENGSITTVSDEPKRDYVNSNLVIEKPNKVEPEIDVKNATTSFLDSVRYQKEKPEQLTVIQTPESALRADKITAESRKISIDQNTVKNEIMDSSGKIVKDEDMTTKEEKNKNNVQVIKTKNLLSDNLPKEAVNKKSSPNLSDVKNSEMIKDKTQIIDNTHQNLKEEEDKPSLKENIESNQLGHEEKSIDKQETANKTDVKETTIENINVDDVSTKTKADLEALKKQTALFIESARYNKEHPAAAPKITTPATDNSEKNSLDENDKDLDKTFTDMKNDLKQLKSIISVDDTDQNLSESEDVSFTHGPESLIDNIKEDLSKLTDLIAPVEPVSQITQEKETLPDAQTTLENEKLRKKREVIEESKKDKKSDDDYEQVDELINEIEETQNKILSDLVGSAHKNKMDKHLIKTEAKEITSKLKKTGNDFVQNKPNNQEKGELPSVAENKASKIYAKEIVKEPNGASADSKAVLETKNVKITSADKEKANTAEDNIKIDAENAKILMNQTNLFLENVRYHFDETDQKPSKNKEMDITHKEIPYKVEILNLEGESPEYISNVMNNNDFIQTNSKRSSSVMSDLESIKELDEMDNKEISDDKKNKNIDANGEISDSKNGEEMNSNTESEKIIANQEFKKLGEMLPKTQEHQPMNEPQEKATTVKGKNEKKDKQDIEDKNKPIDTKEEIGKDAIKVLKEKPEEKKIISKASIGAVKNLQEEQTPNTTCDVNKELSTNLLNNKPTSEKNISGENNNQGNKRGNGTKTKKESSSLSKVDNENKDAVNDINKVDKKDFLSSDDSIGINTFSDTTYNVDDKKPVGDAIPKEIKFATTKTSNDIKTIDLVNKNNLVEQPTELEENIKTFPNDSSDKDKIKDTIEISAKEIVENTVSTAMSALHKETVEINNKNNNENRINETKLTTKNISSVSKKNGLKIDDSAVDKDITREAKSKSGKKNIASKPKDGEQNVRKTLKSNDKNKAEKDKLINSNNNKNNKNVEVDKLDCSNTDTLDGIDSLKVDESTKSSFTDANVEQTKFKDTKKRKVKRSLDTDPNKSEEKSDESDDKSLSEKKSSSLSEKSKADVFGQTVQKPDKGIEVLASKPNVFHHEAATKIQNFWRNRKIKPMESIPSPEGVSRKSLSDTELMKAATSIQALFRGYLARKNVNILNYARKYDLSRFEDKLPTLVEISEEDDKTIDSQLESIIKKDDAHLEEIEEKSEEAIEDYEKKDSTESKDSTNSLQHSGELHDSVPVVEKVKDRKSESVNDDTSLDESSSRLLHSGEFHDDATALTPNLRKSLEETAQDKKCEAVAKEEAEEKSTSSLVHSGEFHDVMSLPTSVPNITSKEEQEQFKSKKSEDDSSNSLVHSGELHDTIPTQKFKREMIPNQESHSFEEKPPIDENIETGVQRQCSSDGAIVKGVDKVKDNLSQSLQHSSELHDSVSLTEKVQTEKIPQNIDSKITTQYSNQMHDSLPLSENKSKIPDTKSKDDDEEHSSSSLIHSGEFHDFAPLPPTETEKKLKDDSGDDETKHSHSSNRLTEQQMEEAVKVLDNISIPFDSPKIPDSKTNVLERSVTVDEPACEKKVAPTLIKSFSHATEIPTGNKAKLTELEDEYENVKKEMESIKNDVEKASEKSSSFNMAALRKEIEAAGKEEDNKDETTASSLTHSGELHDAVVVHQEKKIEKKESQLTHSSELHDTLTLPLDVSKEASSKDESKAAKTKGSLLAKSKTVDEEDEKSASSLMHSGEFHDVMAFPEGIQKHVWTNEDDTSLDESSSILLHSSDIQDPTNVMAKAETKAEESKENVKRDSLNVQEVYETAPTRPVTSGSVDKVANEEKVLKPNVGKSNIGIEIQPASEETQPLDNSSLRIDENKLSDVGYLQRPISMDSNTSTDSTATVIFHQNGKDAQKDLLKDSDDGNNMEGESLVRKEIESENDAALKIQSNFRGYQARRDLKRQGTEINLSSGDSSSKKSTSTTSISTNDLPVHKGVVEYIESVVNPQSSAMDKALLHTGEFHDTLVINKDHLSVKSAADADSDDDASQRSDRSGRSSRRSSFSVKNCLKEVAKPFKEAISSLYDKKDDDKTPEQENQELLANDGCQNEKPTEMIYIPLRDYSTDDETNFCGTTKVNQLHVDAIDADRISQDSLEDPNKTTIHIYSGDKSKVPVEVSIDGKVHQTTTDSAHVATIKISSSNVLVTDKAKSLDTGSKSLEESLKDVASEEMSSKSVEKVLGEGGRSESEHGKGGSDGLLGSGEFHDAMPVSLLSDSAQLGDNSQSVEVVNENLIQHSQPPAGVEILTSRRAKEEASSDVGGVVDAVGGGAQAPTKDASNAYSADVHSANAEFSMETEKRKNATIIKKDMESEAATKIQAGFRGYKVRKQLKQKQNGTNENSNGRRATRRKSSGVLSENGNVAQKQSRPSDLEQKSATKIQAGIRGFLVRRRQKKTTPNNS